MSYKFVLDFGVAEYDAAVAEMDKQDDRGMVIVATSLCEEFLVRAIKSRFVNDDPVINGEFMKGYGPLASFRARIDLGFFLGIYNKSCHSTLMKIKDVRNKMAHIIKPLHFSTQDIKDQMVHIPSIDQITGPWRDQRDLLTEKVKYTTLPSETADMTIRIINEIVSNFEKMPRDDRHRFMAYIQNRTVSFILAEAAGLHPETTEAYLVHL